MSESELRPRATSSKLLSIVGARRKLKSPVGSLDKQRIIDLVYQGAHAQDDEELTFEERLKRVGKVIQKHGRRLKKHEDDASLARMKKEVGAVIRAAASEGRGRATKAAVASTINININLPAEFLAALLKLMPVSV